MLVIEKREEKTFVTKHTMTKEEICQAVKNDKTALFYADEELKSSENFIKQVAKINPEAIVFASKELLRDVDYMKEILDIVKSFYDGQISKADATCLIDIFASYKATIEEIGKACMKAQRDN